MDVGDFFCPVFEKAEKQPVQLIASSNCPDENHPGFSNAESSKPEIVVSVS
jgi:hypothetical protein